MRRTISLLLLAGATLLVGACADSGDASGDTDGDASPPSTDAATTSAVIVTVPEGVCEDTPDPADYPPDQLPPVIPPCEIPDELVVHTIRSGVGRAAEAGDTIVVDYTGMRSEDGAVFDSSYTRDVPLDFPLGRGGVIPGWDQGLLGARAGSLLKLDIPADLAYGDNPPSGDVIRPGEALSFVIEVRAVVAPVTAADAPLDLDVAPSVGATEVTTEDLVVGDGATVEAGDTAIVHALLVRGDNRVVLFDTWEREDPLQIVLEEGGSLPGIVEGLEGATVGSRRVIRMPPESAFGESGDASLGLPAGVDLIVIADIVGVY